MLSSRFFQSPVERPPFLQRPSSVAPVTNCGEAVDGPPCPQALPIIVFISLAAVLVPILLCILLCACFKISVICCRDPADERQQEAARTADVALTNGKLVGVKLVILAGGDEPSLVALPCAVQGNDGSEAADSRIGLETQNNRYMDVEGRELEAPPFSSCVSCVPA